MYNLTLFMTQPVTYCHNCRVPLTAGKRFCSNCGVPQGYPPHRGWFSGGSTTGYPRRNFLSGINIPFLVVFIVLVVSLIIFAVVQFGPKQDTKGPAITNVSVPYISRNGAKITWYTDKPASTQIEYGRTTNYGAIYPVNPMNDVTIFPDAGVLYHELSISTMPKDALYHFRVVSRDAKGNKSVSADYSFKTRDYLDEFNPAE